jgi:hypothetical protein
MTILQLRIKETLAYTHISLAMVSLIKQFFLDPELSDEKKGKIDDWINESKVNDQLFDLFIDVDKDEPRSFESTFRMLERIANRKMQNEGFIKYASRLEQ